MHFLAHPYVGDGGAEVDNNVMIANYLTIWGRLFAKLLTGLITNMVDVSCLDSRSGGVLFVC